MNVRTWLNQGMLIAPLLYLSTTKIQRCQPPPPPTYTAVVWEVKDGQISRSTPKQSYWFVEHVHLCKVQTHKNRYTPTLRVSKHPIERYYSGTAHREVQDGCLSVWIAKSGRQGVGVQIRMIVRPKHKQHTILRDVTLSFAKTSTTAKTKFVPSWETPQHAPHERWIYLPIFFDARTLWKRRIQTGTLSLTLQYNQSPAYIWKVRLQQTKKLFYLRSMKFQKTEQERLSEQAQRKRERELVRKREVPQKQRKEQKNPKPTSNKKPQ